MIKKLTREINWLKREKYAGKECPAFFIDLEKLKDGEPVDYLIGFIDFLGVRIDLSLRPFIPRPETEFWVEKAIGDMSGKKNLRVLDVFSGSGCVGLAVLKNTKSAKVDFIERNEKFIKQIRINLKINKMNPKRYRIIHSNMFEKVKDVYDYILANPPYIPESRKDTVQKSVLKFEPKEALFAGKDGLSYITKFLGQAGAFLRKQGKIYLEFGFGQKREIDKFIKKQGQFKCRFFKDQYGKWRYLTAEL